MKGREYLHQACLGSGSIYFVWGKCPMIGHVVQDCVRPTHPVPFNPVIPVKAAQHKTAQTRQLHRCTVLGINGTNATLHLPTAQMFHGDWILFL